MKIDIKKDVALAPYTTFGIGGKAEYFCVVNDKDAILEALNWAHSEKMDFHILGGGSNVLVADNGVLGLTILNRASNYKIVNNIVITESGTSLSRITRESIGMGLSGLDFAIGIPGTIGGAVVGNAGAYGRSISDSLISGEVWENGNLNVLNNLDFNFGYRYSNLKNNSEKVFVSAEFSLYPGNKDEMRQIVDEDKKRRKIYEGKNCGSYFCNVNVTDLSEKQIEKMNNFIVQEKVLVGKLFDNLGLKGKKIGGAMVSEKHANVILNTGTATAKNILDLEKEIMRIFFEEYGIVLIPEVTKIGEF